MKRADLSEYLTLMDAFVLRRMSAGEFETKYLALFKNENRHFGSPIFEVLDKLFGDVDAYVSDPALRRSEDLGEEELLECCKDAQNRLLAILSS